MRHDATNLTGPRSDTTGTAAHRVLADEFDAWATAGRGAAMEKGHLPTASQALARIRWPEVRTFLDLGTGNGYAVRHAAAYMDPDGLAIGLDVSLKMLEDARATTEAWVERRRREGLPVAETRFVQAPFDAIPLAPESVDAAFSNEAIYYAPDVEVALRAIHAVLRPRARFYCSIDFYEENGYSHRWSEQVGVPMVMDSEAGWVERFRAARFADVRTERLLDPTPLAPLPDDADDAARAKHAALGQWKQEIGTLLLVGMRA